MKINYCREGFNYFLENVIIYDNDLNIVINKDGTVFVGRSSWFVCSAFYDTEYKILDETHYQYIVNNKRVLFETYLIESRMEGDNDRKLLTDGSYFLEKDSLLKTEVLLVNSDCVEFLKKAQNVDINGMYCNIVEIDTGDFNNGTVELTVIALGSTEYRKVITFKKKPVKYKNNFLIKSKNE